jgi:hypothetical protein
MPTEARTTFSYAGLEAGANGALGAYLNVNSGATLGVRFAPAIKTVSATYASIRDLAVADLQGDSVFDASTGLGLRRANDAVFVNDGPSSGLDVMAATRFDGASFASIGTSAYTSNTAALGSADLDGDGLADVVTANGDGTLRVMLAQTRAVGASFGTP